jgi:CHAT domain-containing protein
MLKNIMNMESFYSILKEITPLLFPPQLSNRINALKSKDLVIIPHLWLHLIPFEAMRLDDMPLSIKYNLTRHYSLDLVKFSLGYPEDTTKSALIIANFTDREGRLIEDESLAVKDILSKSYDVKYLKDAQSKKVKSELDKASIIHFDCHGEFNLEEPLASALILKDRLLASDIVEVSFKHYPFVFMNACEVGEGTPREERLNYIGDELFGFVRAFNISHTPTILAPAWRVEIRLAKDFSIHFYKALLDGENIGNSLKMAREEMYNKYKSRDWAAYCLYGNPFKKLT